MIKVDPKSIILHASIEEDAIPDVQVHQTVPGRKLAHLHLTRNKDKAFNVIMGGAGTPAEVSAINIKAAFAVTTTSPADDLSKWKFRFLQVAKTNVALWVFAGRTATGGSISMNLAYPPAVPANLANEFLLDSLPGDAPFMPGSTPTMLRRTSDIWMEMEMDDHPSSVVPLELPNDTTKETNYLVRVVKDFFAVTTLVAVDESGKIQPLAYLTWEILWNASFQWRGGTCRSVMKQRQFKATTSKPGAPAEKAAARLVANPTTDASKFYNAVFEQAKGNILKIKPGDNEVAMSESRDWVPGISEGPVFP